MRLAVSNLAWRPEEDPRVLELLLELGVRGVEIAPTKVWPHAPEAGEDEIRRYRDLWRESGIEIVALQALLFGAADLGIFESAEKRQRTLDHLSSILRIGSLLGAGPHVFGAPKSRRIGDSVSAEEAWEIGVSFFREAGHRAAGSGVTLCIEPCPGESSRDFVVDSREGLELVRRVDSPGFGLHLDTAAMTLSGEPLPEAIQACCGELRHFHASEPGLRPPGRGQVAHERFAGALRSSGYSGWVSLEMLGDPDGDSLVELRRALTLLRTHYGP